MNILSDAIITSATMTTAAFAGIGIFIIGIYAYRTIYGIINPSSRQSYAGFSSQDGAEFSVMMIRWWVVMFVILFVVGLVGNSILLFFT
jgi:hypothetical protein